jgi:hypothetical protein
MCIRISYFSSFAKEADTILRFRFTSTEICPKFPLGCKMQYRAYASDEVVEITEDLNENRIARGIANPFATIGKYIFEFL